MRPGARAAEAATIEKAATGVIATLAEEIRQTEVTKDHYVGIIRVTGDDMAPTRIEMRMEKGALAVDEGSKKLDTLFGGSRPLLFTKDKVVNEITNPAALVAELIAQGKNPWDFLNISVKSGLDLAVAESPNVVAAEAYVPKAEFLNTVEDIKHTLSANAKTFLKVYLETALKPRVVLGTKGAK